MKPLFKSLVPAIIASSLLLLPIECKAEVNTNKLAEVTRICQQDVNDPNYYQHININPPRQGQQKYIIRSCVFQRYYNSLLTTQYPWLVSTGNILPNYPGSVIVGYIAYQGSSVSLLDCIASENALSKECSYPRKIISLDSDYSQPGSYHTNNYLVNVCPSCVAAENDVPDSDEKILQAFIQWFTGLKIPQRRAIIALLGNDDKAQYLRNMLYNKSQKAEQRYEEISRQIERQALDERRHELLGN